jgi:outer membrane receptor protein involved in Fe transport
MVSPRFCLRATSFAAALLLATTLPLVNASAASSSVAQAMMLLQQDDGLTFQESSGVLGAEGPAADVAFASEQLELGGVGNTALYTGAGETGTGFVVISGNALPPTTDFEVMGMTAANVENSSSCLDAVYSDDSSLLDALVPPGKDMNVTPVDVDYAAYPVGSTPPPDNHGLNPDAQFDFGGVAPLDAAPVSASLQLVEPRRL